MEKPNVNTEFEYNGKKYWFDVEDVECMSRYKKSAEKLSELLIKQPEDGDVIEYMTRSCGSFRDFFDEILGDGAGIALCGERLNVRCHTEAYAAFLEFVEKQAEAGRQFKYAIADTYMNRAQRRAAAKAKK